MRIKNGHIKYWLLLGLFVSTIFILSTIIILQEKKILHKQAITNSDNNFKFLTQCVQNKLRDRNYYELDQFLETWIKQYNNRIISLKLISYNGYVIHDFNSNIKSSYTYKCATTIYYSYSSNVYIEIIFDLSQINTRIRSIYFFSHLILLISSIGLGFITYLALRKRKLADEIDKKSRDLSRSVNELKKEIEQKQQIEQELRKSEQKHSDLFNNAPDLYLSIDSRTGIITDCNLTVINTLQYTKEEIIGKPVIDLYHPDYVDDTIKSIEKFNKTGTIKNEHIKIISKEGKTFDVIINSKAIYADNGEIIAIQSSWRDITDIKKVEIELAKYRDNLELLVSSRTKELEDKNAELVRLNKLFINREFRIKELREELKTLKNK